MLSIRKILSNSLDENKGLETLNNVSRPFIFFKNMTNNSVLFSIKCVYFSCNYSWQ